MMSDLYDPAFPTGDDDDDSVGHHTKELNKSEIVVDILTKVKEKAVTMVIAESCTELQKSGECDQFTKNELQSELVKSTHLLQEVNNFNGLLPMVGGNCGLIKGFQGKVDQLPLQLGVCNLNSDNIPVNRDHSYSRKICPELTESVVNNSSVSNGKSMCATEIDRSVSPPLVETASSINGDGMVEDESLDQKAFSESIPNNSKRNSKTVSLVCDTEDSQKSDEFKKIENVQEISPNDLVHDAEKESIPLDLGCLLKGNTFTEQENFHKNDVKKEAQQTNSIAEVLPAKIKEEPLDLPGCESVKEEPPEATERESQSTPEINKKKHKRGTRNSASEHSCGSPSEDLPVRRSSRIRSLEQKKEKKGNTKGSKERAKKEDNGKKSTKIKKEPSKDADAKKDVQDCETVSEGLHSETSSSNETFATVDKEERKEDDAESVDGKGDQKENSRAVSPVSSASSDCKARQSPMFDIRREEEFMSKPEKVKSRWRRNSELERGGMSTRSTPLPIPEILDGKSTSLKTKESIISEEPPVLEPVPTVPPKPQPVSVPVPLKPQPVSVLVSEPPPVPVPPAPPAPVPTAPVEKLPQFDLIDENIYLFERKRSKSKKEVRRMVCDCAIIKEEIEQGYIGCGEDCLNRLLMIECGSRCALGDSCGNKRFQKKQFAKTEPFKTEKKGWGLRAVEDISVGTFVMEYVGEVLSYPDFKQRVKQYAREKNYHYYFMALKSDEIIDATCKGSMSRFINHSCEPNCETQKWTVNGELRIGFFTTIFVKAGQELTFDYQFQRCYSYSR